MSSSSLRCMRAYDSSYNWDCTHYEVTSINQWSITFDNDCEYLHVSYHGEDVLTVRHNNVLTDYLCQKDCNNGITVFISKEKRRDRQPNLWIFDQRTGRLLFKIYFKNYSSTPIGLKLIPTPPVPFYYPVPRLNFNRTIDFISPSDGQSILDPTDYRLHMQDNVVYRTRETFDQVYFEIVIEKIAAVSIGIGDKIFHFGQHQQLDRLCVSYFTEYVRIENGITRETLVEQTDCEPGPVSIQYQPSTTLDHLRLVKLNSRYPASHTRPRRHRAIQNDEEHLINADVQMIEEIDQDFDREQCV